MAEFEFTFQVGAIPERMVDSLIDDFDATIGTEHGGQASITVTMPGSTCRETASQAIMQLTARGLDVRRLAEDLVTRADIAERLGVTRQAVGNWVRGDRQGAFPAPANAVSGGVWLWGDVADWARTNLGFDTLGLSLPTRADIDVINGALARRHGNPWAGLQSPRQLCLAWHSAAARPIPAAAPRIARTTTLRVVA